MSDEERVEPYRNGKVHVMADRCDTCVFRPGNLMHLGPGQLKGLTDHVQATGVPFTCHQTLPYNTAEYRRHYGGAALCAGAVEAYGGASPAVRLALALDVAVFVPPAHQPADVADA